MKKLSGNSRRAKVELIDWHGMRAVKKTFKPNSLRYLDREKAAVRQLEGKIKELPEILESGDNYIIYPYYKDKLKWERGMLKMISIKDAKHLLAFLEKIYDEGYAFIDFHPMNVLYDKKHGFKIIDYEFFYEYANKPECFEEGYDIAGIPKDFSSDAPSQGDHGYNFNLLPYIGVDTMTLKTNNTWQLHKKRIDYFVKKKLKFSLRHKVVNYFRNLNWKVDKNSNVNRLLLKVMRSEELKQRLG